jgi:hypothetical protein
MSPVAAPPPVRSDLDDVERSRPVTSIDDEAPFDLPPTFTTIDPKQPFSDEYRREFLKVSRLSQDTLMRQVTLRTAMAALDGMSIEEDAVLFGVRRERLVRWIRGDESIPRRSEGRLNQIAELLRLVRHVVPEGYTRQWFFLSVPALDDKTPFEVLSHGDVERVVTLAQGYCDPSFG